MTMSTAPAPPQTMIESRLRSALWGMFSGDALAAPSHWYYGGFSQIQSDYGANGLTGYTKPVTTLRGSILNKSDPNGGGRLSYGNKRGKDVSIIGDVINHGKLKYWDPKKSYHYHATLQKGENTLEMQLARVLMKSIAATNGKFDEDHFRKAYVEFMTKDGSHNDTYASTCHRMFFANLVFIKKDPKDCPDNDGHNVDAIDGLVLPSITALAETARHLSMSKDGSVALSDESRRAIEQACARTAAVTRSSPLLEKVSAVWADLVSDALLSPASNGDANAMEQPLREAAQRLGLSAPKPNRRDQMSACYLSQSVPPTLDMLCKYTQPAYLNDDAGIWKALLANANIGGENVHRGAVLGAILGARVGDEHLPAELKAGLFAQDDLAKEIDTFVKAVVGSAKRSAAAKEL
ncbi:hypothetical protein ACHAXT_010007 [Thalassiosira profunda]